MHAMGFTKVNTIWLVYVFDWNVLSYDQRKVLLTIVFNNYRIPASELDTILEVSCNSSIDEVWQAAHKMEDALNEFGKRFDKIRASHYATIHLALWKDLDLIFQHNILIELEERCKRHNLDMSELLGQAGVEKFKAKLITPNILVNAFLVSQ